MKRVVNFILPVQACNLQCHYCYIGQENRFKGTLGHLDYSIDHIKKAMSCERWGGVCHINICGLGETLLPEYSIALVRAMLENGHIVTIVTNGTITPRIKEILAFPEHLVARLFWKFSFHYLQLKQKGLLDVFFENVSMVSASPSSFSVELTVNDECIPYIDRIQELCWVNLGVKCHVIESRNNNEGFSRLTKLDEKEHFRNWDQFDSPLFEFQKTQWMQKRGEFCYAGDWIVSLNVESGWMIPCFAGGRAIQNVFEKIDEPINFMAIGKCCPWKHCYAAHILLTSGVIPELCTPTYFQMRERKTIGDRAWIQQEVVKCFNSKLSDENTEYSKAKKEWINCINLILYQETYCRDFSAFVNMSKKNDIQKVLICGESERINWTQSFLSNKGFACDTVLTEELYKVMDLFMYDKIIICGTYVESDILRLIGPTYEKKLVYWNSLVDCLFD